MNIAVCSFYQVSLCYHFTKKKFGETLFHSFLLNNLKISLNRDFRALFEEKNTNGNVWLPLHNSTELWDHNKKCTVLQCLWDHSCNELFLIILNLGSLLFLFVSFTTGFLGILWRMRSWHPPILWESWRVSFVLSAFGFSFFLYESLILQQYLWHFELCVSG